MPAVIGSVKTVRDFDGLAFIAAGGGIAEGICVEAVLSSPPHHHLRDAISPPARDSQRRQTSDARTDRRANEVEHARRQLKGIQDSLQRDWEHRAAQASSMEEQERRSREAGGEGGHKKEGGKTGGRKEEEGEKIKEGKKEEGEKRGGGKA
eukprot:3352236-Rhodomonas_salina.1